MGEKRWKVWSRFTIPCEDGLVYLVRLRVIQTPWFGLYVHDINRDDDGRFPHDHPWSFVSIVLRGWYTERVWPVRGDERMTGTWRTKTHRTLSMHRMRRGRPGEPGEAHQITEVSPRLRTLILVGPKRSGWGFYSENGYVSWQDYYEGQRP